MAYALNFIDLFAGAGGLSEGFIRAGFTPIAHIEMNKYACDTLRSRMAYHYLIQHNRSDEYVKYLREKQVGEERSAFVGGKVGNHDRKHDHKAFQIQIRADQGLVFHA